MFGQTRTLLKKALYYAYTVVPEISFEEEPGKESDDAKDEMEVEIDSSKSSVHHLTAPEIKTCTLLMTQISDLFSSTLYQPPPALHMACTDVYASLWMDKAVQPAFADGGAGDPFRTLKRLRGMEWVREKGVEEKGMEEKGDEVATGEGEVEKSEEKEEERDRPCVECVKFRREEWGEEARSIWKRMDDWLG